MVECVFGIDPSSLAFKYSGTCCVFLFRFTFTINKSGQTASKKRTQNSGYCAEQIQVADIIFQFSFDENSQICYPKSWPRIKYSNTVLYIDFCLLKNDSCWSSVDGITINDGKIWCLKQKQYQFISNSLPPASPKFRPYAWLPTWRQNILGLVKQTSPFLGLCHSTPAKTPRLY